jgi:site-specific recombinase XerD
MKTHSPQNERVKHAYFTYLREAKGMSETSIDQTAKALSRFESYTGHRDFKLFHRKQAEAFKQHLASQRSERTKEPLSKASALAPCFGLAPAGMRCDRGNTGLGAEMVSSTQLTH